MSFPRYEKYKDSGWSGWGDSGPLGHVAPAIRGRDQPLEVRGVASGVRHWKCRSADGKLSAKDGRLDLHRVRPLADVQTGYTYFRDGDVAIAKIHAVSLKMARVRPCATCATASASGRRELYCCPPKATETT